MTGRAVLFDIGGVLVQLGEQAYRAEVAAMLGLAELPAAYLTFNPDLQRGRLDEDEVWAAAVGRPVDTHNFDPIFLGHFPVSKGMLALACEVRAMGVRTGILSNTQPSHVRCLRQLGFMHDFDPVILSCEAGWRKPDPEIYQAAVERLGLPPERVAYIDDVPEFLAAGREAGLHAILHAGDVAATRAAVMEFLARP